MSISRALFAGIWSIAWAWGLPVQAGPEAVIEIQARSAGQRVAAAYIALVSEDEPWSRPIEEKITDETGEAFHYAQRLQVGATVDRSPRGPDGVPTGFDLALTGVDPTDPSTLGRPAWSMAGSAGTDRLDASIEASEAASQRTVPMGLGLHLTARKPAALHDRGHDLGVVERRRGVGHRDDSGEPAERGGAGAGLDGLGLLLARLAEVDLDVDEPGRDDAAFGIEDLRTHRRVEARPDLLDPAVAHEHVGDLVALARLVEDATTPDDEHFVRQPDLPSR